MDTATQALLGAVVGQAAYSHRLGRRALWWGALGGFIPDLDVLAIATHGPFGELLYHRGFTHALWFGPVVGPALGWLVWRHAARRKHRRGGTATRVESGEREPVLPDPGDRSQLGAWIGLFTLALFTHPLIDIFTAYGTQLWAPFSMQRYAWNGVAIIDPVYSGILIAALLMGTRLRARSGARRAVAAAALVLSWSYLGYGVLLNGNAEDAVRQHLTAQGATVIGVRAYPTLLQPYLRRVVARTPDDVHVGLYTPWRREGPLLESFEPPTSHPLIDDLCQTPEGSLFVWFAMGEVTPRVLQTRNGFIVEIDDFRYGGLGQLDQGMWGIRAIYDRNGKIRGPVRRFRRVPEGGLELLKALWQATWGDFSGMQALMRVASGGLQAGSRASRTAN